MLELKARSNHVLSPQNNKIISESESEILKEHNFFFFLHTIWVKNVRTVLKPSHSLVHVTIHTSSKEITLASHVHGMWLAQMSVEMGHMEM